MSSVLVMTALAWSSSGLGLLLDLVWLWMTGALD